MSTNLIGGNTWERVHGNKKEIQHPTNAEFAKDNVAFQKYCADHAKQPTTRQASKYRNRKK